MRKKDIPTRYDLYYQFITLNKTNKQLCEHYKVSESVIHTWKRYYNLTKDISLVLKSYKAVGYPKGHIPFNKGKVGLINGEGCKKTWFTKEKILDKAKKSFGVPKVEHIGRGDKRLICLSEEIVYVKNKRNGKTYANHKRIGYARFLLQQQGIEVPKGYVVFHKDGDYLNNDIGNLEIISRAELCKRTCLIKRGLK